MTRRERADARLARRLEWAEKRQVKAEKGFAAGDKYRGDYAFNTQPGHIPERARINRMAEKAGEDLAMAQHHRGKASGIADQLERTVFSDDHNAIERLESRIAEREAEAERYIAINRAWRKSKGTPEERAASIVASGVCGPGLAKTIVETMAMAPWLKSPLDATSLRAAIRRDRERIAQIREARTRCETE